MGIIVEQTPLIPRAVHRLGDDMVNFYIVEEPAGLVLIDSGLPAHWDALRDHLASSGAVPGDIKAVLLTHAHPDHVGLAARVRREAGAPVWIHSAEAATLAAANPARAGASPERSTARYLVRRPAAMGLLVHLARNGGFHPAPVGDPEVFESPITLTRVPGAPEAVPLPGHTPGSAAYVFRHHGVIFTGDALVSHDGLTGLRGPRLVCRGFTHDSAAALASLDTLAGIGGDLTVLPGHGSPMAELSLAVEEARRVGIS
jgi:glyoxylase-like metal-dependent hydrolase (beta-lactamase superfamily II)